MRLWWKHNWNSIIFHFLQVHLEDLPTKSQLQIHHHPKNQNKVFLLNSQTVGQMAKLNLQPIAISVLETQASTKKLDCRKKWLAVQNVVDQVWIVHSQSLMASNFASLWLTDPKFSAIKDLYCFSTVKKVQEASRILRMGFALSKWPHLLHKMGFVDSLTQTTVSQKRGEYLEKKWEHFKKWALLIL